MIILRLIVLITIIALIIFAQSCSPTAKANRGIRKLEKLKTNYADVWQEMTTQTVRIDTFIEEVEVPGHAQVIVDSAAVDSLAAEIDSLMNIVERELQGTKGDIVRETITRYVPRLIKVDTVQVDTLGMHLTLYYNRDAMQLNYTVKRDTISIKAEESVDIIAPTQYITIHKIPWWIWAIIVLMGLALLGIIFKR